MIPSFHKKARWFLLFISLFSWAIQASAHGYVIRALPEDRATLTRPPTRLQYWFSEDLEPAFSEIHLYNQENQQIASGQVDPDNHALLSLQIPPDLPDGAYIVELRPAFASDGHVVAESRVFFVGDSATNLSGQAASNEAIPLEVFWRSLLYASTAMLFGIYALYIFVLVPAWGNRQFTAGFLPPRVMRRLSALIIISLISLLAALLIALLQQTMVFFNISALQVLQGGQWQVVRIGSRFGDVWNARIVILLTIAGLHAASIYFRERQPETVRPFWMANIWLVALLLGAASVNSHAAGSLLMPWLAVAINWIHTLATAYWVGAILTIALVLPVALRPYTLEEARQALIVMMSRFSNQMLAILLVVISTGIYNSSNWFLDVRSLSSSYALSLAIKLSMVFLLLAMGAMHHAALHPQRFRSLQSLPFVRFANQFRGSLRLEAGFALLTLLGLALLSATPTPTPEFIQQTQSPPQQTLSEANWELTMAVIPGGIGINTYDLVLRPTGATESPISPPSKITLQWHYPLRDIHKDWQVLEEAEPNLYVTVGDDIDRAGKWWSLIDLTDVSGQIHRFAFEWEFNQSANPNLSMAPSPIHYGALLLVLLALLYLLRHKISTGLKAMNWHPTILLIAFLAFTIAFVLLGIGASLLNQQQQDYYESLNPIADPMNPTLPDANSLLAGEENYFNLCAEWPSAGQYENFLNQIHVLRDEQIYQALYSGWRDLPACQSLSESQAWDTINFIRTLTDER
ncbi:hypothetical protein MASR2M15_07410 [Anaerolineales bacterium]